MLFSLSVRKFVSDSSEVDSFSEMGYLFDYSRVSREASSIILSGSLYRNNCTSMFQHQPENYS